MLKLIKLVLNDMDESIAADFENIQEAAIKDFFPSRGKFTSTIPVILLQDKQKVIKLVRWDLVPNWWNKPLSEKRFSSFNAKAETIVKLPSYRSSWASGNRCVVPATSFFEWPDKNLIDSDQPRIKHQITIADQPVFFMAAIWDSWKNIETNELLYSASIITTEANNSMKNIPHNRMPIILSHRNADLWLNPELSPADAYKMLMPYDDSKTFVEKNTESS